MWNKDRIEAGLLEGGACPGLWGWEAPEASREGHQGLSPGPSPCPGGLELSPALPLGHSVNWEVRWTNVRVLFPPAAGPQASSPLRWLRGCSRLSTHMLSAVTSGAGNGDVRPAAGSRARLPPRGRLGTARKGVPSGGAGEKGVRSL